VRAVPRQDLVLELLVRRHLSREHLGREQALEEVVVAAVLAVAPREAEHTGVRVRLEHRAHDVRRHPEPVGQRPMRAFEVPRGEWPFGTDPLEYLPCHLGVLVEEALRALADESPEPRVLAREDERKSLVVRLEHLALLVQRIGRRRPVVGDACVEDEIVVSARDRDRIELDGAPALEDLEHALPALERAGGGEEVAGDEEASRRFGGDLHGAHRIDARGTGPTRPRGAPGPPQTRRATTSRRTARRRRSPRARSAGPRRARRR
jgi:hypothetical protein